MCGIAGQAGPKGSVGDPEPVLRTLRHRGPDACGVDDWDFGPWQVQLLHTRLAINDLNPRADQPLRNEDGQLSLIFNGEIYNSPELRRQCEQLGHRFSTESDGEVILHLWEDHGEDALRLLNGIFAIAILDRRTCSLTLARDPVGVKPLFWVAEDSQLWFASEPTALELMGAPLGSTDVVGLAQFLTFLWIPAPRTPFDKARSLLPGELLVWHDGVTATRRYADVVADSAGDDDVRSDEAEGEVGERLRAAVDRQMLSDVPVGIMASGGVDSSLLWWAARDALSNVYTIDWSTAPSAEGLHEDTAAVRVLERTFSGCVTYIPGHDIDVGALPASGDLIADPAAELCRLISARAREDGVKVLLSGQGGDELFAGYRRHVLGPLGARIRTGKLGRAVARAVSRVPGGGIGPEYLHRFLLSSSQPDPLSSYMTLCSYSTAADRARALDCSEDEVSDDVVWQQHRRVFDGMPTRWSLLRRFRALDLAVYMPGLGLTYADRAGMQESVEVRVPWLDLELVAWALRLPDAVLVRGRVGKWLTQNLALSVLPAEVVNRPKRGFGAPITSLARADSTSGRAFRQGAYFSSATSVLERWRNGRSST